jgi:threonine/homoserine/homoserine lactone efflux protein
MPAWMGTIDSFTVAKAAAFGLLLSGVNPKNLLLIIAGAAAIAQTGTSAGSQAVALIVFAVVATAGTGAPLVIYFALGRRSAQTLSDLKDWMARNNAAIMAAVCLIIAAKLLGDAISGLG